MSKKKVVIPKELELLAEEARKYESAEEFVSTQIFEKSTIGTDEAIINKNFTGKTFADKLTDFYNNIKSQINK